MQRDPIKTKSLSSHRRAVFLFLFLVLYHFLIVNRLQLWKVSEISFTYHIVDYGIGFRSQLLPGAIFYGLFGQYATPTTATVYETLLILLFFAGVSFYAEKFILSVEQKQRQTAYILILFFMTGPYTFAIFTDELGMLDVYWLFFSLAYFFLLNRKGLRFLIPILFILSLLVHFSSVLNYLILFSILILYNISLNANKKTRAIYISVFVLSLTATAGLFIFFLLNHTNNLPISQEDFHHLIQARGGSYLEYYDYSLFNEFYGEYVVPPAVQAIESPVLKILQTIFYKMVFTLRSYAKEPLGSLARFAFAAILLSPIVYLFYKWLNKFYKNVSSNRLKRVCILLMMVQFPFTSVLGCLFSPDVTRWFTHAFLVFFTMILYVSYHEEKLKILILNAIEEQKASFPALIYFLAYFLVHSWAYC